MKAGQGGIEQPCYISTSSSHISRLPGTRRAQPTPECLCTHLPICKNTMPNQEKSTQFAGERENRKKEKEVIGWWFPCRCRSSHATSGRMDGCTMPVVQACLGASCDQILESDPRLLQALHNEHEPSREILQRLFALGAFKVVGVSV